MSMFSLSEDMLPGFSGTKAWSAMPAMPSFSAFPTADADAMAEATKLALMPANMMVAAGMWPLALAAQAYGLAFAAFGVSVSGADASADNASAAKAAKPKTTQKKPVLTVVETIEAPEKAAAAPVEAESVAATPVAMDAVPAGTTPTPRPAAEPVAMMPASVAASATGIMPEDFMRPKGLPRPGSPDDLKMIAGVGPKLEGLLNDLGIWTFAQIAAWTPQEIAWVDDYLSFKGRITRDDWLAQADALAVGGRDEYVARFGREPR